MDNYLSKMFPGLVSETGLSREHRLRIANLIWSRLPPGGFLPPDELIHTVAEAPYFDEVIRARALKYAEHTLRATKLGPGLREMRPDLYAKMVEVQFLDDQLLLKNLGQDAEHQIFLCILAYWAQSGFAQIELGHTFASALIMTHVPPDIALEVQAPFKAFVIELPTGLLEIEDRDRRRALTRISVTRMPNKIAGDNSWAYTAETDSSLSFWRFGATTSQLLNEVHFPIHESATPQVNPLAVDITDRDERVALCIGRLIVNTCLAMNDPSNVKEIGPGHRLYAQRSGHKEHSPEEAPVVRTFRVGQPVKHDFRSSIRDFIAGKRERQGLDCQITVAGHFKRQVFGPGRSKHRIIWIQPYRRGPEGAPILIRPHVLGNKTAKSEGDQK
jgi:hypothetical protein